MENSSVFRGLGYGAIAAMLGDVVRGLLIFCCFAA
jgi:hypothetical protein